VAELADALDSKSTLLLGNEFAVAVSLPFPESFSGCTERFVTPNSFSMIARVPNNILAGEVFVKVFSIRINPRQTAFPILWDSANASDLSCAATNLFCKGFVWQFARDDLRMLFGGCDNMCP
jgi:hypothetical protein